MDNITLVETNEVKEKVQKVMRQTDYSEEVALEKLKLYNYDITATIKAYLGVPVKKPVEPVKSVNQEIYKQLRYKLDSNMRDYRQRVEKGEAKKII
jgi:KaiC/GvpD/RAD55 family RecA-like ATPase